MTIGIQIKSFIQDPEIIKDTYFCWFTIICTFFVLIFFCFLAEIASSLSTPHEEKKFKNYSLNFTPLVEQNDNFFEKKLRLTLCFMEGVWLHWNAITKRPNTFSASHQSVVTHFMNPWSMKDWFNIRATNYSRRSNSQICNPASYAIKN